MPKVEVLTKGSVFDCGANIIVIPVNCRGVAGKGLALEFANRHPVLAQQYRRLASICTWRPGTIRTVYSKEEPFEHYVLFATKNHWRDPSQLNWVKNGLDELVRWVNDAFQPETHAVAIPALGCGLGGLNWPAVEPLILAAAERMEVNRVLIFAPKGR